MAATSAAASAPQQTDPVRSCTVTINNELSVSLYRDASITPQKGTWATPPPDQIAAGESTPALTLMPADDGGTYGQVAYTVGNDGNAPLITFQFQCPKTHSVQASYDATQGSNPVYE